MSEIKFEELKHDDEFFNDLRDGNFILVLGAGFSFGIRNIVESIDIDEINEELKRIGRTVFLHFDLCKTIPLAGRFVNISNIIFEKHFYENEYRLAANQWSDFKLNSDFDISFFFRKLFTPDTKYIEDNIELLKSIFIPKWHNIYTLNFDTVLEKIILKENLSGKYKIYSYPEEPGFETRPSVPIIAHLHGAITTIALDNLVFSDNSYSKIRHSQQSLYDNLHAEIKSGKKILILGTQLNDSAIDDKLTHDIHDFIFYHLDIEHNTIEGKKFANNKETSHYITLFEDENKKGTPLFLQFLLNNKSRIENISITGAKLIDKKFIEEVEKVGTGRNFQPADFYLAKQIAECQWYGITKGWYVEREDFRKLRTEVFEAFKDAYREPKILARLLGRGGSGKSTLLRKLAYDLAYEDFAVIWIIDKEFVQFCEKGISDFSNYPNKKFLVIIEDWYRIKQSKKESSADIINSICNYKNVRIIIGDRTIDNSIAIENLYNPEGNKFKFDVEENRTTIPKILAKISDWQPVADVLLKDKSGFKSSLYLILFTIGRKFQILNGKPISSIDDKSFIGHFQSILESDLREIAIHYPGYAKAIFYLAKVYATFKIHISFDVFEKIAKRFNGQNDFATYNFLPDETKSIIDIYINKSLSNFKSAKDLSLIAFNHDILAEDGLAKVEYQNLGTTWYPFSDAIKIQMLDLIIAEGDIFSISAFLYYLLSNINEASLSKDQKLKYITDQYDKGNYGSFLSHLFYKDFKLEAYEKQEFALKFVDDFISGKAFSHSTISLALNELISTKDKGEANANAIIDSFISGKKMFHAIINNCLQILKETKDKGEAKANAIIDSFIGGTDVHYGIISNCLQILKETKDKGEAKANAIIDSFIGGKEMFHAIISNCLQILKETKDKGEAKANAIIDSFIGGKEMFHAIISNCLQILKETKDKGEAKANAIIDSFIGGTDMHYGIISNCLKILKETKDKGEAKANANAIIDSFIGGTDVHYDIISNCLQILKETKDKGEAKANAIIDSFIGGKEMFHAIISNCLQILKETKDKGEANANAIIDLFISGKEMNHAIISNCLQILKETKDKGEAKANAIINSFIEGKEISKEIISNCLQNLKETKDKGEAKANAIIDSFNGGTNVPYDIICNCLQNLKETKDKGEAKANSIIDSFIGGKEMYHAIISNCLQNLGGSENGFYYATYFLKDKEWRKVNWSIVFQSLYCFSSEMNPPSFVVKIVDEIINDNSKKINEEKGSYFRYKNLMKIPFHNIPSWKNSNASNITNWENNYRDLVTNTILGNLHYPTDLENMCTEILRNWRYEILQEIRTNKKDEIHFGNHIKFALGHPTLKVTAKIVAIEMLAEEEKNPKTFHESILKIIFKIVQENPEFPEWKTNTENESDNS